MKIVLSVLLLLFQLQPVLGTVACLGASERAAAQECRMPEHGQATFETTIPLLHAAGSLAATRLIGLPQAPPFHPPRA